MQCQDKVQSTLLFESHKKQKNRFLRNLDFSLPRLWDRFSPIGKWIYRVPSQKKKIQSGFLNHPVIQSLVQVEYVSYPFPSHWIYPTSLLIESKNDCVTPVVFLFIHGTGSFSEDAIPFLSFLSITFSCLSISLEYPGYSLEHTEKQPSVDLVNWWTENFVDFLFSLKHKTQTKNQHEEQKTQTQTREQIFTFDAETKNQNQNQNESEKQTEIQTLRKLFDFKKQNLFVIGHSIGSTTAIHIGTTFPEIGGVILISPLTCLKKFVTNYLGWGMNIPLFFVKDRVRNVDQVKNLKTPLLIFTFGLDKEAPTIMGQEILENAIHCPIRNLVEIAHRTHLFKLDQEGFFFHSYLKHFIEESHSILLSKRNPEQKKSILPICKKIFDKPFLQLTTQGEKEKKCVEEEIIQEFVLLQTSISFSPQVGNWNLDLVKNFLKPIRNVEGIELINAQHEKDLQTWKWLCCCCGICFGILFFLLIVWFILYKVSKNKKTRKQQKRSPKTKQN